MDTLAELILERDKERGGGIVMTMPTTSDAVAAQNQPAPSGKPGFTPSAALLLLDVVTTTSSSSRLASDINPGFQRAHYLVKPQLPSR